MTGDHSLGSDHVAAVQEGFYVTEEDPLQATSPSVLATSRHFLRMDQRAILRKKDAFPKVP